MPMSYPHLWGKGTARIRKWPADAVRDLWEKNFATTSELAVWFSCAVLLAISAGKNLKNFVLAWLKLFVTLSPNEPTVAVRNGAEGTFRATRVRRGWQEAQMELGCDVPTKRRPPCMPSRSRKSVSTSAG